VFLDPDNGLAPKSPTPKSVAWEELRALRSRGRALLVYHHQTRFPGGAVKEYAHRVRQIRVETGAESIEESRTPGAA